MLRICDELKIDKSKVMKEAHEDVKAGRYKNMSEALAQLRFLWPLPFSFRASHSIVPDTMYPIGPYAFRFLFLFRKPPFERGAHLQSID